MTWSCEPRFHGESWGWEVQTLRDGELVIGQYVLTRAYENRDCATTECHDSDTWNRIRAWTDELLGRSQRLLP